MTRFEQMLFASLVICGALSLVVGVTTIPTGAAFGYLLIAFGNFGLAYNVARRVQ